MTNTNLFIQAKTGDTAISYTALHVRKLIAATYPIEGVLGTGQLKVTQRGAGANMSVDVAPGGAVVQCDLVTNGGSYLLFEDATVNVTIPAAPASGTRTHMLYERAYDPQSDGGTDYVSKPYLSPDTGSGAPPVQSAYLLASIAVTHGQASVLNANITDLRGQASGPPPDAVAAVDATTSVNGRITVPHSMGAQPSFASLTLSADVNTYASFLVSRASDVVTWELRSTTSGNLASGNQTITGLMHVRR